MGELSALAGVLDAGGTMALAVLVYLELRQLRTALVSIAPRVRLVEIEAEPMGGRAEPITTKGASL